MPHHFGNFVYSGGCDYGYSHRNYCQQNNFFIGRCGGGLGYNSFGFSPYGGFSAGPSRVSMNFNSGCNFFGSNQYYSSRPYYAMGMGMGMPPISYGAAETVNKIRFGASGLEQIVNGIDYLSYALQPRQSAQYLY